MIMHTRIINIARWLSRDDLIIIIQVLRSFIHEYYEYKTE